MAGQAALGSSVGPADLGELSRDVPDIAWTWAAFADIVPGPMFARIFNTDANIKAR